MLYLIFQDSLLFLINCYWILSSKLSQHISKGMESQQGTVLQGEKHCPLFPLSPQAASYNHFFLLAIVLQDKFLLLLSFVFIGLCMYVYLSHAQQHFLLFLMNKSNLCFFSLYFF